MIKVEKNTLNKWLESVGLMAILFFIIVFPFSPRICVVGILVYVLTALIGKRRVRVPLKDVPVSLWAIILFYLLHLFSLIYSDNIAYGLRDLEIKMSLLFIPLAAIFIPATIREFRFFTFSFIFSAFFSAVVCLLHSSSLYMETSDSFSFYYDSFSYLMHPTYYTILLNMALLLQLSLIDKLENSIKSAYKVIYWSVFVFLLFAGVLASSRAGLVILLLTCGLYIGYYFRQNLKKSIPFFLVLFLTTGFFFTLVIISNPDSRFGILINEAFSVHPQVTQIDESKVDINPLSHRIQLWETAWNLCKIYPFGTGAGDVQDVLVEEYARTGFEKARVVRYNPHNQYLQSFLAIGIVGFILLLLGFFGNIKYGFHRYNSFFFLASVIALNGLFESVLEVQRGVLLFSFVILFFGVNIKSGETSKQFE